MERRKELPQRKKQKNKRSLRKKGRNRNIVRRDESVHGAIPLKISKVRTAQIVCAADIFFVVIVSGCVCPTAPKRLFAAFFNLLS